MIALVAASETASATRSAVLSLQPLRRARMRAACRARRTLAGSVGRSSSPQITERAGWVAGVGSEDSAMHSLSPDRRPPSPGGTRRSLPSTENRYVRTVEHALDEVLRARECPHLAMLLRTPEEVYVAQASFYGLAIRRNGWVLHRAIPGRLEQDREGLRRAGLPVDELERDGRMVLDEKPIEEPPETWAQRWVAVADEALRRGFDAVWWTGPPIPSSDEVYRFGIAYDQAWERCIHGHPAVSLCLYIVDGLNEEERRARAEELGRFHDALLMSGPNGVSVLESLLAATGRREAPREEAPVIDLS